jgi:hypothetical protein
MRLGDFSDVIATVLKQTTYPAWSLSIFAVVGLIAFWLAYANRDNPRVRLESEIGGGPKVAIAAATVFFALMFVVGIFGTAKPEVVVWFTDTMKSFEKIKYLGGLALFAVGIALIAVQAKTRKTLFWSIFGLGAIALLAWLYLRFGVEIKRGTGIDPPPL